MGRGLACLWLVAVVQLAALLVVSVVQQLNLTDLSRSDVELRILLVGVMKARPDYNPSDDVMQIVFEDDDWEVHDDDTSEVRHKRQLGYEAILADILRAQENIIAAHCANASKTCVQGPKGDKGAVGFRGPQGQKGARGPVGYQGQDGPVGRKGEPGPDGLQGPQGPPGDDGPVGPEGPEGDMGSRGQAGDTGPAGEAGLNGAKGETGEPGDPGAQGPAGTKGAAGAPGQKGQPGSPGGKGPQGQAGNRGEPGQPLEPGCECIKKPQIKNVPTQLAVQLQDSVHLTCQAEGYPLPTVTWVGENNNDPQLVIDGVKASDLGPHTCIARSNFGNDTKTVNLHSP